MGHAAYPTASDLNTFLLGYATVTSTILAGIDLDQAVKSSRANFETAVGRVMLAVSQTRTFDPPLTPRGVLDFAADLASLTTFSISGVAKTVNTDFYLGPTNADSDGRPWAWAEPVHWWPDFRIAKRGISVVGSWGYALTIPDDAWQAILEGGAMFAYPALSNAISKGLQSLRRGDEEKQFGGSRGGPLQDMYDAWKKVYENGVRQYKRVLQGI